MEFDLDGRERAEGAKVTFRSSAGEPKVTKETELRCMPASGGELWRTGEEVPDAAVEPLRRMGDLLPIDDSGFMCALWNSEERAPAARRSLGGLSSSPCRSGDEARDPALEPAREPALDPAREPMRELKSEAPRDCSAECEVLDAPGDVDAWEPGEEPRLPNCLKRAASWSVNCRLGGTSTPSEGRRTGDPGREWGGVADGEWCGVLLTDRKEKPDDPALSACATATRSYTWLL